MISKIQFPILFEVFLAILLMTLSNRLISIPCRLMIDFNRLTFSALHLTFSALRLMIWFNRLTYSAFRLIFFSTVYRFQLSV